MLTPILLSVATLVAIFLIVAALQPAGFRYVRHTTIAAQPAVVFGFVNELQQWQEWSPWAKKDPAAKIALTGPAAGVGAAFAWDGNRRIGQGSMTVIASTPSTLVRYRLDFLKPFKSTHNAEFTLQPEGGATVVTWTMTGQNNFMGKAFGLVVNCDKMVGRDFEKGLAGLKVLAEAAAGR